MLALADSGASGHNLTMTYATKNKWPAKYPISVHLPNGKIIKNTHECYLPIPQLPKEAVLARIFPELSSASLLSIGQLCDAGCNAKLDANTIDIYLHQQKNSDREEKQN